MRPVLQGATSWATCLAAASCTGAAVGQRDKLGSWLAFASGHCRPAADCCGCCRPLRPAQAAVRKCGLHVWLTQPVFLLHAPSSAYGHPGANAALLVRSISLCRTLTILLPRLDVCGP